MIEESIEVTIDFRGKFSIGQSSLSKEEAIKDTMDEFHRFVQEIYNNYDYVTKIDFNQPKIEGEILKDNSKSSLKKEVQYEM